MLTHAIFPETQELPLCIGAAYRQGGSPGQITAGFDHRYALTSEPERVSCQDCAEWLHA